MDALGIVRRQGLGGLFGGNGATGTGTQTTTSSTGGLGGVIGAFTSIINGVPTVISNPSTSSTTPTSTHSSITSTSSTSQVSSTTSTPPTTTSSITSTSAPVPTVTPTPTPTASPIVYTSSDGTSIIYVTSYASSTPIPTAAPPTSFLQNKPLEAGVFSLVGIVVLIIIFVAVTFTMRRRRRDRLENDIADAVTFDPTVTDRYADEEKRMNAIEKYSFSEGSSAHGHGFGYTPQLPYAPPKPPQYGYHGQGYEQQVAYHTPLPQVPVHSQDKPINSGGANLTRKYSDRKPVPPLLPNPVYDPSRSPVLPSHFYGPENPTSPTIQSPPTSAPASHEATPDHFDEDPYTGVLEVTNR